MSNHRSIDRQKYFTKAIVEQIRRELREKILKLAEPIVDDILTEILDGLDIKGMTNYNYEDSTLELVLRIIDERKPNQE